MDDHEHIRSVFDEFAADFTSKQKLSSRKHDGREIRLFDDQLNFFLLALTQAAIKDGCSREWLVERFMTLADEAMVAFRRRTPKHNQQVADILLREASRMADVRRGKQATTH